MMLPVDEVIGGVLEVPIGSRSPIWYLDSHQDILPVYSGIHPPPQLDPPKLLTAADL